ncbi:O5AS1 protein, partial [Polypterus senegalus]
AMKNSTLSLTEFVLACEIESNKSNNSACVFIFIYLLTLFGNFLVILVIKMNQRLQTPMHLYIGTLAVLDLMSSTVLIPELVAVLLNHSVILYGHCVLQMFLIASLEMAVTLLFALMACDRYIAVLYPLRYPSLITNKTVRIAVLGLSVFSTAAPLPILFLVSNLSFCHGNVLPFCFCKLYTVMHVACTEGQQYVIIMSVTTPFFSALPLFVIILSYVKIAWAALKISSVDGKRKVFSTCLTHLIVVTMFYVPLLIFHVLPGSGVKLSNEASNILVIIVHVIPPMMNPVVYSFRNNEIKSSIFKMLLSYAAMKNTTVTVTKFVLDCTIESQKSNSTVFIFIFIYLVTLIGNVLVILVIKMNRHLQTPMYLYIGTLAVVDLLNSTVLIPELVAVLLNYSVILYGLCILQMFLIAYLEMAVTLLFALMACDRYVAVHYPLRSDDEAPLQALIILSYVKIARAALKISSIDGKRKVYSTCVTHLIVVGMFYLPLLILNVLPGSGVKLSIETSNILVIIAHAIPPMMNPFIYSFRNSEIKSSIFKMLLSKKQIS